MYLTSYRYTPLLNASCIILNLGNSPHSICGYTILVLDPSFRPLCGLGLCTIVSTVNFRAANIWRLPYTGILSPKNNPGSAPAVLTLCKRLELLHALADFCCCEILFLIFYLASCLTLYPVHTYFEVCIANLSLISNCKMELPSGKRGTGDHLIIVCAKTKGNQSHFLGALPPTN